MEELLVIICAELILLASIIAMMVHRKRADVLSRFHETDYAVSHGERRKELRTKREQDKPARLALPAREQTAKIIPPRHAQSAQQVVGRIAPQRTTPDQGHRAPPSLPHGVRIYAIGDIHGRSDLLGQLLPCIEADCRRRPVQRAITVFVGDYIDRGRHSREVINLLLRWRESHEAIFLRGNHETFLPKFLSDPKTLDDWRQWGGLETLLSYGLQPTINPGRDEQERLADQLANLLPKEHFEFLQSLELFYSCGDFFFVHAGIRPGVPIDEQAEEDLLWIREAFLTYEQPFELFIVHGHSPVEAIDYRSNRINIDTGAFATGHLTCIVIEGCEITQLSSAAQAGAFSAP